MLTEFLKEQKVCRLVERKGKADESRGTVKYQEMGGLCLGLGGDPAICLEKGFLTRGPETIYNNVMCTCLFSVRESIAVIRFSQGI